MKTGETFEPNVKHTDICTTKSGRRNGKPIKHASKFSTSLLSETKHTTPDNAYVATPNTQARAYVAERITIETKPETKHISIPPFPFPVRKYYSI